MAQGTLYTTNDSFRGYKALIAAQYSGAKIDVAKDFALGTTNKNAKFLSKFPLGKVPALETKSGEALFESNAVAFYVANEQLRGGKDAFTQAQVIQWLSFADNELVPAVLGQVLPALKVLNASKQQLDASSQGLKNALGLLNSYLLNKTFLAGERITLADIVVASTLLPAYQYVLDPSARANIGNVNRWFTTLINQPQFKAVLGDVTLCEKVGAAIAQAKPKQEKPAKKQQEKKAAAPAADDGDDIDALTEEKPTKDPFEQFPKGNFNMDDFKRFYSNNPEDKAIDYFWEKFDKDNYSIWFCEYKYPEDLKLVFMTCNLMSGMMQRLDKMRKNAFGNLLLFGEDNKNIITGLWFWRGHELAFNLSDDWKVDYESYNWRKLDANAAETKALVKQYLTWEGEHKGLKFNQGKCFK